MIDSELETLGTDVILHAWRSSERLAPALRALAPLATLMGDDVSVLDPAASNLKLSKNDRDVADAVRYRLLFDGRTFATYLVYWGDASTDPLQLSLTLPVEGAPAVHRLLDGATPAGGRLHAASRRRARHARRVPLLGRTDAGRLQRGRGGGVRRAERRRRPSGS